MNKDFLINSFNNIKNKKCWLIIGPSAGSIISIGFGNKILRKIPIKNPMLSEEYKNYDSEYELMILCVWRLETKTEVIVGSDEPFELISNKIKILKNKKMLDFCIDNPAFDFKIFFDNDLILNIFCSNTNPYELDTNYDLFTPNGCISVGCKGELSFENSNFDINNG